MNDILKTFPKYVLYYKIEIQGKKFNLFNTLFAFDAITLPTKNTSGNYTVYTFIDVGYYRHNNVVILLLITYRRPQEKNNLLRI